MLLSAKVYNADLRLVENAGYGLVAGETGGDDELKPAIDNEAAAVIFGEKPLRRRDKPADERKPHNAAVGVAADVQVGVPALPCAVGNQVLRHVHEHDGRCVRAADFLLHFVVKLLIPIGAAVMTAGAADANGIPADLGLDIVIIQDKDPRFSDPVQKLLAVLGHVIDLVVAGGVVYRCDLLQFNEQPQEPLNIVLVRAAAYHVAHGEYGVGLLAGDQGKQLAVVLAVFLRVQVGYCDYPCGCLDPVDMHVIFGALQLL